MAHIDLTHADMKPAPIIRYEIAQGISHAKRMLVISSVAATIILVFATMFLSAI